MNEISLQQMDEEIAQMKAKQLLYEEAKKKSSELYNEYEAQKLKVIQMLQASGKTKYSVDGIGTVSIKQVFKVQTPKTTEEKAAAFEWIKKEMGEDGFLTYAGINYMSLNSLYNLKSEEYAERGEVLTIPGVGMPEAETVLSFRSK